jgi:two-component system sensor histidine kinase PilS (NtrC family)
VTAATAEPHVSAASAPADRARTTGSADATRRAHARRISYFMLFRLAMLAAFTVLAGVAFSTEEAQRDRPYNWFVVGTLVVGYALTIVYARLLPRIDDLSRFAWIQTAFDIMLSAVVVQMTGGVESGFATLYLIAVLGAATMGGRKQTWAAAGACAVIYVVMSSLEYGGSVVPFTRTAYTPMPAPELWATVLRTLAAILGVTVLTSYLNTQLASSVSLVGNLRALNENIVHSLSSGLVTLDNDGRILYFNPAARQILELDDALIGRSVDEALPGVTTLDTEDGDTEGRHELRVSTREGREIVVGLNRVPLLDADGNRTGWVINFQDVTRLHELTQKLRRNDRLAALGGMAASVAHEIRNPLAAISGSAELLEAAELGDEDRRLLRVIGRESTRLTKLVGDLLAFTRPRPPQRAVVGLRSACRQAVEAFGADPANRGIEIAFESRTDPSVHVDPAQLTQVLWNLMRNAAEAMEAKGRVAVRCFEHAERAIVEVSDDGPGIASETVDSIFDPFFTTKESGTGFGLAIVHRIVEENGGTIGVESAEGQGTTFRIAFPIHVVAVEPEDSGVLSP